MLVTMATGVESGHLVHLSNAPHTHTLTRALQRSHLLVQRVYVLGYARVMIWRSCVVKLGITETRLLAHQPTG